MVATSPKNPAVYPWFTPREAAHYLGVAIGTSLPAQGESVSPRERRYGSAGGADARAVCGVSATMR